MGGYVNRIVDQGGLRRKRETQYLRGTNSLSSKVTVLSNMGSSVLRAISIAERDLCSLEN